MNPRLIAIPCALCASALAQTQFQILPLKEHIPTAPGAVTPGDVDADGDLDIVRWSSGTLTLLRNDGSGYFENSPNAFGASRSESPLAMADFDGDGDADLIAGNRLWLNDGRGRFTDGTSGRLPPFGRTDEIHAFDADADGDIDFARIASEKSAVFLNDGRARFTRAPSAMFPNWSADTVGITTADLDGDGDQDVLVRTKLSSLPVNCARLLVYDRRNARFVDRTGGSLDACGLAGDALFVDIDNDRDLDLVYAARIFGNDGKAKFTELKGRLQPPVDSAPFVTSGDVDGDAVVDLVFGDRFYRGDGRGAFREASSKLLRGPFAKGTLADFDGDRDLDLLLGNATPRLLLNDGKGSFLDATSPRIDSLLASSAPLAVRDFDGDGNVDILEQYVGLHLRRGLGEGRFHSPERILDDPHLHGPPPPRAILDLDGDGDIDVMTPGSRGLILLLNDGKARFSDASARLQSQSAVLAVGDFDNDGDPDPVLWSLTNGARLFVNDGRARFIPKTRFPAPHWPRQWTSVDVDGDGDLDLITVESDVYLNDGKASFTRLRDRTPPLIAETIAGDFDRDGDVDLLSKGIRGLLINDGRGKFQLEASRLFVPIGEVRVFDVELDGDLDVLASSGTLLNDGKGFFKPANPRRFPSGARTTWSLPADVDRDGDADLVAISDVRGAIWINTHRQLRSPSVARPGRPYRLELFATPGYARSNELALPLLSSRLLSTRRKLGRLGLIGIDPSTMIPLPLVVIPANSGRAELLRAIPPGAGLLGATLHWQALLLHSLDSSTWRLTNTASDAVVGF